jgi:hypothetical protein
MKSVFTPKCPSRSRTQRPNPVGAAWSNLLLGVKGQAKGSRGLFSRGQVDGLSVKHCHEQLHRPRAAIEQEGVLRLLQRTPELPEREGLPAAREMQDHPGHVRAIGALEDALARLVSRLARGLPIG